MKYYDDIINLPRPISKHPKASINSRAAQFAPFSALSGFEEEIYEAKRLTDNKIILTDEEIDNLNIKLAYLKNNLSSNIKLVYFVKDKLKKGGKYVTYIGLINKIDTYNKLITIRNNIKIRFTDIFSIILKEDENNML